MNDEVTFREGSSIDAEAAAALLDSVFADRTPDQVRALLSSGGLCLLAGAHNSLIGVATASVARTAQDALPAGRAHVADDFGWHGITGIVKSLVVAPRYRGQGLCSKMVAHHVRWMRRHGAQAAFSEAWIYPDGQVPARGPLAANGFTEAGVVERFWEPESIEQGYTCDQCGGTCRCSALLFHRTLL